MNQNKKLSAYPDREQTLKGTNFKSRRLKMTKKEKWYMFLILEVAIALTMFIWLADLTAKKVADAIYPQPEPVNALELNFEPSMTIPEHICNATNGENCEILVNLAKCESSLNKEAYHINTNGTVDLGLFQINSVHKDISPSEKLDVYASTRWTNEQIKKGNGHIWVCWTKI